MQWPDCDGNYIMRGITGKHKEAAELELISYNAEGLVRGLAKENRR